MITKTLKYLLTLFCELQIALIAVYVLTVLFLQIVITPMIIFTLVGSISLNYLPQAQAIYLIGSCAVVGAILGLIWANSIRKKYGIVKFHAFLLSTPEIDGRHDRNGNAIAKPSGQEGVYT
ncbi:hypothetical protein [Psychrobium sp. 1_MG-2023]|uniref:hypothetical protein n=1 Tax=Psychrobium sp. 1_MG-2023 TaxID=3062624 RepID=UPI000C34BB53|nr:hypothetical protein [Psychrobium sp. 1_MG-2023]MDP2562648.1 hypothetical protein [Psychrobium sp. 1_MG-2023]PKF53822.1 hypothetical protein CW748_17630 [Alteromonadales bacterium alter-6D02]